MLALFTGICRRIDAICNWRRYITHFHRSAGLVFLSEIAAYGDVAAPDVVTNLLDCG